MKLMKHSFLNKLMLFLVMFTLASAVSINEVKADVPVIYITDTIGGVSKEINTENGDAGNGWTYQNNQLILNGFNGEAISSTGDLTIKLVGENRITPEEGAPSTYVNVIDINDNLTIVADEDDADAKLIVKQTNFKGGARIIKAGNVYLNGGTLDIDVAGQGQHDYALMVIYNNNSYNDSIYVNGNANLKIKAKHANVRGVNGALYANTAGLIDIKVEGSGSGNNKRAVDSLYVNGSGQINLDADTNGLIVNNTLIVESNAISTLHFKGILQVFSMVLTSSLKLDRLKFRDAKIGNEDVSSDELIFSQPEPNIHNNYYLSNHVGEKITEVVVETKGSGFNENLELIQSDLFNIPYLEAGTPFKDGNGLNLMSGVKAGTGNGSYTFNLAEGSTLPPGFTLTTNGLLSGTPSDRYEAGNFNVNVTSAGVTETFTINYEESIIDKLVTGINIVEDEFILNINDEATPTVEITPEDATINTYKLKIQNAVIAQITNEKKIKAIKAGKTKIDAESTQGGKKDSVDVYVKEKKPTVSVDSFYLSGLVVNQDYLIDNTSYKSDSQGKIKIAEKWFGKTIQIVKKNVVTKCNSDVQSLKIPTKPKITLSITVYTYNKKVRKPSVTVKFNNKTLKKGTDYDVKYQTGRKYVNRYYVKVNFKNNYSGSQTLYFKIIPKTTKISKLTAYQKKIKVKWSKQSIQTSGYQVRYSTSKTFKKYKTVTIKSTKTTSKTISKLSKKKKYYFKIRTYKNVKINGKTTKIYSNFSKVKAKTTKR